MEKQFINNIKKQLKRYIRGEIVACVINDVLIVDIFHGNTTAFRFTQKDFYRKCISGLTSKQLVNTIIKNYESHILRQYFIKNT